MNALQAQLNDLWAAGLLRADPLADDLVDVRIREAQAHLLRPQESLHGLCEHTPAWTRPPRQDEVCSASGATAV